MVADSTHIIYKPLTHTMIGTISMHYVLVWWQIPFTSYKNPYYVSLWLLWYGDCTEEPYKPFSITCTEEPNGFGNLYGG